MFFHWPCTIVDQTSGTKTVTARHETDRSKRLAHVLACAACGLTMCLPGLIELFTQLNQFGSVADGGRLFLATFMLGLLCIFPGAVVTLVTEPIFRFFLRPRTTVRFFPEVIEVEATSFDRWRVPIYFTNLAPQAIRVSNSEGVGATLGSFEETANVRMVYGAHSMTIATFCSIERANRFCSALTAAACSTTAQASPGFEVLPVPTAQLYTGTCSALQKVTRSRMQK